MTRDLRLYLLVVVLPAILLVVGGIRLVSLESARAARRAAFGGAAAATRIRPVAAVADAA